MTFQFATCVRHTALEYIQDVLPDENLTDTPESAGPLLDLVAKDILRVQDPRMHKRNGTIQIVPGNSWDEKHRPAAMEAGKILSPNCKPNKTENDDG